MVQVQDLGNTIGSRNVSWSVRCNGALGVVETSRHSSWGYHNRIDVVGAVGKVVVEASKKKTPLLFARDFGSSFDAWNRSSFLTALREGQATFAWGVRCAGNATPGFGGCQKLAGKSPRTDLGDTGTKRKSALSQCY
jgi:hypothetical protein